MKLTLLVALSLLAVGAAVVAPAPGAAACYDSCVVGPCEVSFRPILSVEDPTGTVVLQPSAPSASCDL